MVANAGAPEGIVTDRDITIRVVAEERDPVKTRVSEIMQANPAVLFEDRGVFDAAKMFSTKAVRRLPVVDRQGQLVGIVALDDLLMLLGSEMGHVSTAFSKEPPGRSRPDLLGRRRSSSVPPAWCRRFRGRRSSGT